MIENDTQRRVLGHCRLPRAVSDIKKLLADDVGVENLDTGEHVSSINVREVIQDLEGLGAIKSFYGVNPHALNTITELDDDVITHPSGEDFPDGTIGEIWADQIANFQPDAPYYIMTQEAWDFLTQPGPDVPPEHEGLAPGPVIIGMQGKNR